MPGLLKPNAISKLVFYSLFLSVWISLPSFADFAGADTRSQSDTSVKRITAEMTRIAQSFIATLPNQPGPIETAVGYDRKKMLALDVTDEARTNYVYWPYLRKGLPLAYMTAEQKMLVHDLLNTALSAKGYLSTLQIMRMEEILSDEEVVGFPRGAENYTLAIFATPDFYQGKTDSSWGWRFEGHHLSLNFTIASGVLSVTPSFMGASPAEIRAGTLAGFRNLRGNHEAGLALINALDTNQRAKAIQDGRPPFDIVSGNLNKPKSEWNAWKSLPRQGIEVRTFSPEQKDLAQRLLDEVVTHYRAEISRSYLAQIDVNELWFVWLGGIQEGDAHYYRLEGPDFFFEYDLVQSDGNHVHTVWRSKSSDFGEDLLAEHRRESH